MKNFRYVEFACSNGSPNYDQYGGIQHFGKTRLNNDIVSGYYSLAGPANEQDLPTVAEPEIVVIDAIPPTWTKTEFLDEVGDAALDQFIALLDAGDVEAKRFQYRLDSTELVDTAHEKVQAGLDWLAAHNGVPGFTNAKRDKLKGV